MTASPCFASISRQSELLTSLFCVAWYITPVCLSFKAVPPPLLDEDEDEPPAVNETLIGRLPDKPLVSLGAWADASRQSVAQSSSTNTPKGVHFSTTLNVIYA